MLNPSGRARGGAIRWLACWLALTLLVLEASPLQAGLLDKIKQKLGKADTSEQTLGEDEAGAGLKEALRVGTESVVDQLGTLDGFNLDPQIHIPLPGQFDDVRRILDKIGMGSMLTDLELRLNRAAEAAAPKAKSLFLNAIEDMTLDDAMAIYRGPDDAATQYFKAKMSAPLALAMKPLVDESLADVGAAKLYGEVMKSYAAVPFAPKVDADLSDYVVHKGMDGIFYYLAKEEAAIRRDPLKRTTEILKKVFGK